MVGVMGVEEGEELGDELGRVRWRACPSWLRRRDIHRRRVVCRLFDTVDIFKLD